MTMHPFLVELQPLVTELGGEIVAVADIVDGDVPLRWEGKVVGAYRSGGLQGALDRLIKQVEREMGAPIATLNRSSKQEVVRRLDELGAFNLRKAVEDIADHLEVSRFTVYNYLNSQI